MIPASANGTNPEPARTRWRKSSYSNNGGNCVEVARSLPGTIAIRDSKNPSGPTLSFTSDEWRILLGDLKRGHFGGMA